MLGEKAAERDALRASDVMSELKLRPPNPYGEKCGRACDPSNFKTRSFQKPKSAAPAEDKRSLRCCGRVGHPAPEKNKRSLRCCGKVGHPPGRIVPHQ
jgi:hypothetical protein